MGVELIIENVVLSLPDVVKSTMEENRIKNQKRMQDVKEQLLMFACSSPRTVKSDGVEIEWEEFIHPVIEGLLNEYYSCVVTEYVMEKAEEYPENIRDSI